MPTGARKIGNDCSRICYVLFHFCTDTGQIIGLVLYRLLFRLLEGCGFHGRNHFFHQRALT